MAAIISLTKYSKKKDVILTSNFHPNHETPLNLQRYISVVKKEVTELLKNPNYQESNLTSDKSEKIVIMDTADYLELL